MTKSPAQLDAEIAEALTRPRKRIPDDVKAAIEAHALEIIEGLYRHHATVGGKEPCVTVGLITDYLRQANMPETSAGRSKISSARGPDPCLSRCGEEDRSGHRSAPRLAATSPSDEERAIMSNPMGDDFVEIRCCEQSCGYVNARPFTPEANARFCALQQLLGNTWVDDTEVKELIADPASYALPADGTPIMFGCGKCGAKFAWAGGRPTRVSSS